VVRDVVVVDVVVGGGAEGGFGVRRWDMENGGRHGRNTTPGSRRLEVLAVLLPCLDVRVLWERDSALEKWRRRNDFLCATCRGFVLAADLMDRKAVKHENDFLLRSYSI
jgi:hypothetical protein